MIDRWVDEGEREREKLVLKLLVWAGIYKLLSL